MDYRTNQYIFAENQAEYSIIFYKILQYIETTYKNSNSLSDDKAQFRIPDSFPGMEIEGINYTDKENAGKAIIDACAKMTGSDAVLLGRYRGFSMVLAYDGLSNEYRLTMKGTLSHTARWALTFTAISPALITSWKAFLLC